MYHNCYKQTLEAGLQDMYIESMDMERPPVSAEQD